MKVEELRLLMEEVVRKTMREELSSILTEAVQIASTPTQTEIQQPKPQFPVPDWVQELQVSENRQPAQKSSGATKSPMDLLRETARGMSTQDLANFR